MRWDQTEYLLKGVYFGLLLAVALHHPTWTDLGILGGCTLAGLVVALVISAIRKMRAGVRMHGHPLGFLLFLLLENPEAVYVGVVGGLTAGVSILLAAAIVVTLLVLCVFKTSLGAKVRAVAVNERTSILLGVNPGTVYLQTFFIAGMMAGAAGVIVGIAFNAVSYTMGESMMLQAFVVIVGALILSLGWSTGAGGEPAASPQVAKRRPDWPLERRRRRLPMRRATPWPTPTARPRTPPTGTAWCRPCPRTPR